MRSTKNTARFAVALALILALAGCGSKSSSDSMGTTDSNNMVPEYAADAGTELATGGSEVDWDSTATAETSRKIVYNADLSLESKTFEEARKAITEAVSAAGGYLESASQGGNAEDGSRWASYTARIPVERYQDFLQTAGKAGNLVRQSEQAQDITSGYIDVESRLTALNAQRDRLNELAAKAETTADLLEIESQLSEVQYQLENYTQQLRAMDDQVSYSTVTIDLSEVATLTPTGTSFIARLGHAFTEGWAAFGRGAQEVVVAIVYLLPVLLLLAAVLAGFAVAWRRAGHFKKAAAKKASLAAPREKKDVPPHD